MERLRQQHLAELDALDRPGWQRTGRHGQHGEVTAELYETHVAAEESTTSPRSPGCCSRRNAAAGPACFPVGST